MKTGKEKNVNEFNADIKKSGRYQYTDFTKYSVFIATKRQTDEIVKVLKSQIKKSATILDVGCGDGIFTFELLTLVKPKKIVGFDMAESAIKAAKKSIKIKDKKSIYFQTGNAYDAHKMFKKNSFDIIVIRGVLHHLYNPQKAIKSLSVLSNKIIVLEPNGYNPILKIIEKVSPYHRKHEERSFYPPTLNKWFIENGYNVVEQRFFSVVPYFCPTPLAKLLKVIEPLVERIPVIKELFCGTNLIYYEKK